MENIVCFSVCVCVRSTISVGGAWALEEVHTSFAPLYDFVKWSLIIACCKKNILTEAKKIHAFVFFVNHNPEWLILISDLWWK